jgi:hypothetical protein
MTYIASIQISLLSQLQGLDNDNSFYPVNNLNFNNNMGGNTNNISMQKNPYSNNNSQVGYSQQSNNNFDYYRNNNNNFMELNENVNPVYMGNKPNPIKNQMFQPPQQE